MQTSYKVSIAVFDKGKEGGEWVFIGNRTMFVHIEEECGGCGHSEGEIWEAAHDQFHLDHADKEIDFIFLDFEVEYSEALDIDDPNDNDDEGGAEQWENSNRTLGGPEHLEYWEDTTLDNWG